MDALSVALRVLRTDAPAEVDPAPQTWPRWAELLPHVLAATHHADHASKQPDPAVMADVAWLLDRAGTYLREHAQYTDAKTLLERALTLDKAAYGPDHPDVASDTNNLANVLRDLGQPEQARPLAERALAIDEAAYGPDHPTVARDLNNLAWSLRVLGQPEQARPVAERALAIDEAAYGPDHPTVAERLDTLAAIPAGPGAARAGPAVARTCPGHRRGHLRS